MRTLVVAVLLLAGCAGPQASVESTDPAAATTTGLSLSPANWTVGKTWVQEYTVSGIDPFQLKAIVVQDSAAGWEVGTDDAFLSAVHAAFHLPTLGTMGKSDMTITAGDFSWPWYKFPMSANQTWTGKMNTVTVDAETVSGDVTVRVLSLDERGAQLETTANGERIASYDYDVATGWFTKATFYDEGNVSTTITTVSHALDYTGPVYVTTGAMALNALFYTSAAGATTSGSPVESFGMSANQNLLFGFLYGFGASGAGSAQLTAPNGNVTYVLATDPPLSLVPGSLLIMEPGQTGTWQLTAQGAGAFAGGAGALLYALSQQTLTL